MHHFGFSHFGVVVRYEPPSSPQFASDDEIAQSSGLIQLSGGQVQTFRHRQGILDPYSFYESARRWHPNMRLPYEGSPVVVALNTDGAVVYWHDVYPYLAQEWWHQAGHPDESSLYGVFDTQRTVSNGRKYCQFFGTQTALEASKWHHLLQGHGGGHERLLELSYDARVEKHCWRPMLVAAT